MTWAYVLEILPYSLRSRGISIFTTFTGLGVFFSILVNPIALDAIGWKYYILYVVLNACAVLSVYYFYPETKGRLLEEVAEIFDGPQALLPILEQDLEKFDGETKHVEA